MRKLQDAEQSLTALQLLPSLRSGGVERGTLEVAAALVRGGHRSLVMSAGGPLVAELEEQGSEHYTCPIGAKSPLTLRHILPLRRFFEQQRVDIVHVRSRLPAWIAYLAWKGLKPSTRPRFVSTVHGLYSVSAYSAVMTKGERVIAVSDTVKRYIAENYPRTDPARIKVIYRGIDAAEFPRGYQPPSEWMARWEQRFPELKGQTLVALPGRLTRLKGHHDFLQIIAALKQRAPRVVGLVVGGEDPKRAAYAKEIHRAVEQLRLRHDVVFTGERSDIREIYSQCAVVLSLSSKPESFGRTALEALSLGVPVVGYDHGGVSEILGELFPSGRVPVGDIGRAVQAIRQQLSDPDTPLRNTRYSSRRMLQQTLALYRELSR